MEGPRADPFTRRKLWQALTGLEREPASYSETGGLIPLTAEEARKILDRQNQ